MKSKQGTCCNGHKYHTSLIFNLYKMIQVYGTCLECMSASKWTYSGEVQTE